MYRPLARKRPGEYASRFRSSDRGGEWVAERQVVKICLASFD